MPSENLLDDIAETAKALSEHDAYIGWRLSGQFGYPRNDWEKHGATTTYLKLIDKQTKNLERLRKCRDP